MIDMKGTVFHQNHHGLFNLSLRNLRSFRKQKLCDS